MSVRSSRWIAFWALFFFLPCGGAYAEQPRLALVLGNSDYTFGRLKNPANDAALIAQSLREVGFEVYEYLEADQREMKRAIVNFGRALAEAGEDAVGLVYYAGHGVQVGGENYMIPVGAKIEDELDVDIEGVRASTLLTALDRAGNRLNIVILDACRNNPFAASSRSASGGLARMDAPSGTLLAYSTSPGNVAMDGTGRNSPYTQALARAIREPSAKVEDVFKRVRIAVMERTDDKQVPWEASSLTGDFYFVEPQTETPAAQPIAKPAPQAEPSSQAAEIEYWKSIANSDNPDLFQGYLTQFPDGIFATIAAERISSLQQGGAVRAAARDRDIEQRLWDEVKDSGDTALLQSFLAQYPDSIYKGLAETRIASLQEQPEEKVAASNDEIELMFWKSIQGSSDAGDYQAYLSRYPNGQFAAIARNRAIVDDVKSASAAPAVAAALPAMSGMLNWVGIASTEGRHMGGVNWCAGEKELRMELADDNGEVTGFIIGDDGRRISIQGKMNGNKLDARANIARGFRVVGSRSDGTLSGRIWTPVSSTVCGAKFELELAPGAVSAE